MLQTIPSFSYYGLGDGYEDDEEESEIREGRDDRDKFEDSGTGKSMLALKEGLLDVGGEVASLDFDGNKMFLAKGLGIGIDQIGEYGGRGRGGGSCKVSCGGDGRENHGIEEHYKRMVEENPNNPLFLRNYAQFLHQVKL